MAKRNTVLMKNKIKERILSKLKGKKDHSTNGNQQTKIKETTNNSQEDKKERRTRVYENKKQSADSEKILEESVKDHYFTFQLTPDLFTLLYSTLVFKWIQTDKVLIIVEDSKLGYHVELFLRHFRMNSVFLDNEMPVNTNRHYASQFQKGVYTIAITCNQFKENSPNFAKEILEETSIPATIIYFNTIDTDDLEFQCFHANTRAIYHFISKEKKVNKYINILN